MADFVHLHVHSPFSFLDGAAAIDQLMEEAARLGMPALALTDHDNVSGAVRWFKQAQAVGLKPIQGVELTLTGGYHLTLLATGPAGFASLNRLITAGHLGFVPGPDDDPFRRPPDWESRRLSPRCSLEDLTAHARGLIALSGCRRGEIPALLLRGRRAEAEAAARRYQRIFGPENFYLELQASRLPGDTALNRALRDLGAHLGIPLVATADVHYRDPSEFPVHDLLTCVRTLTRLDQPHPERRLNATNYLVPPAEMVAAFRDFPGATANTLAIAERCEPVLELGRRLHPQFPVPPGLTPDFYLQQLTYQGARRRYGGITPAIRRRLDHELGIIKQLGFADYFLLVWDVCRYAREQGIRAVGRGSAADSGVAYCLGITDVDAIGRGLLFERFMSPERAETPDIDVDFDSRHRDRVAAYVFRKYGADRVAAVATYNTFQARSAIRDLGKAMGFAPEPLDLLAKRMPYFARARDIPALAARLPELQKAGIPWEKFETLVAACTRVAGFPRHLGTHLGGLVVSREPLYNVTPLQWAAKGMPVSQFDKDDVEELGLVKLDLLSLRTLGAVDDALAAINRGWPGAVAGEGAGRLRGTVAGEHAGRPGGPGPGAPPTPGAAPPRVDYDRLNLDDAATYELLRSGETIGVFQLESPAQRALQSRLEADRFEDIVASVALIRPGPIKGNMVEPYLSRRHGLEPITYLHPKLQPILEKTYGVILFQEQVIEIAMAVAGFTAGEADQLRRVMSKARHPDDLAALGRLFVEKAVAQGVNPETARTIFAYIQGYAGYGFNEAHAAAFGATAYKTAYLLRHHPAEYLAALLSNQPMGYYPPNTLVGEARRRGIEIRPLDINESRREWLAGPGWMRVGLMQVAGLSGRAQEVIPATRDEGGPYRSLTDLAARAGLARDELEALVLAGALDRLAPNRRALLWQVPAALAAARLREEPGLPLPVPAPAVRGSIPDFDPWERFLREYQVLGIMTGSHAMAFVRDALKARGYLTAGEAKELEAGTPAWTAGLVIRPHRPPTKSGRVVVFFSLEDETGLLDVTLFEEAYLRYGHLIFQDPRPPLAVFGRVERRGRGVSLTAYRIKELVFTPGAGTGVTHQSEEPAP